MSLIQIQIFLHIYPVIILIHFRLEIDDFLAKVDSDGRVEIGGEFVVDEPFEHRSFADSRVSQRQKLDEEIVVSTRPDLGSRRDVAVAVARPR